MDKTIIDVLYEENQKIDRFLEEHGEISLRKNVDNNFRKALLLSIASYFEHEIGEIILRVVKAQTNNAKPVVDFIKNKAIERQYHTYFDWNSQNANKFFSLFGSGFKQFMQKELNSDEQLALSISSFLELGRIRNQLVHQNFAIFPLDKTVNEIYQLYNNALVFIEVFPVKLQEYIIKFNKD